MSGEDSIQNTEDQGQDRIGRVSCALSKDFITYFVSLYI